MGEIGFMRPRCAQRDTLGVFAEEPEVSCGSRSRQPGLRVRYFDSHARSCRRDLRMAHRGGGESSAARPHSKINLLREFMLVRQAIHPYGNGASALGITRGWVMRPTLLCLRVLRQKRYKTSLRRVPRKSTFPLSASY